MKHLKGCLFVIQQTEYHSLCHKGWGNPIRALSRVQMDVLEKNAVWIYPMKPFSGLYLAEINGNYLKNYLIKNSRRLQSSPYFCVGQERTRERSIKSPGAEMVKTKGDTCRGSRENLMRNTRRLEH